MKVIIAGGGSVGRFIAQELSGASHDVTIIDSDRSLVSHYEGKSDTGSARWLAGDACDLGTLTAAGLSDADVVAAATGDDEDNHVV
jgi:trk system potassium uptake protein TrkA